MSYGIKNIYTNIIIPNIALNIDLLFKYTLMFRTVLCL